MPPRPYALREISLFFFNRPTKRTESPTTPIDDLTHCFAKRKYRFFPTAPPPSIFNRGVSFHDDGLRESIAALYAIDTMIVST